MQENNVTIFLGGPSDGGLVTFEPLWGSANVTTGQPTNGVTYIESQEAQMTMIFSAGRCGSTDVAQWFLNTPIPGNVQPSTIYCIGATGKGSIPSGKLNFGFCGTLHVHTTEGPSHFTNVCFAQGHWQDAYGPEGHIMNGWCVKYSDGDWTRTGASAYHFNYIR